jgi:ribosomal silencing factor RsfS
MVTRKKCTSGEEFVFCNGKSAQTVPQLKKEIKNLSQEEFSFHVNQDKNDFYTWIHNCIDTKTAEKIQNMRDKKAILTALK